MTLKEVALHYASLGLSVFPLGSGTKIPLKGSHGFLDATTDQKQIETWWDTSPKLNVGVATGHGLLVIDLDNKNGKEGSKVLGEWEFRNVRLPDTMTVKTPSNGEHRYFYYTGNLPSNKRIKELKDIGVDVQYDGHYVVAAGSVVGKKKYEITKDISIADADDSVLAFIRGDDYSGKRLPEEILEGNRDATLTAQAWKYACEGYEKEEALILLQNINAQKCIPPLEDHIVVGKIESAYRKLAQKCELIKFSGVKSQHTDWLWYPYIPLGKITLMQGDPGSSKTMLCLYLAAVISKGGIFPGEDEVIDSREPAAVIYQTAEDGISDTIKPRLERMNPDFDNIYMINETDKALSLLDTRIEKALEDVRPKLLIMDPLQAYLGAEVDMHRANEVRPVLASIARLAEKYNCSIVFIMHMSKMTSNKALYRGLGSIDIPAVARSILAIGKNPHDEDQRLMCHEKSSLAKNGKSMSYHIDFNNGVIVFDEFNDITADEMYNPKVKTEKPSLSKEEAKALIEEKLSETGYAKVQDIQRAAEEKGISRATLYRAKDELSIKNTRKGFGKEAIVWWHFEDISLEQCSS